VPFTLTRSLMTILVPGGVAISPWVVLIFVHVPGMIEFYKEFQAVTTIALAGLTIVCGTFIEVVASIVEEKFDKDADPKLEVTENWYKYLASSPQPEPVGYRYLGRRVTTMYFELGMALAAMLFMVGTATNISFQLEGWACKLLVIAGGLVAGSFFSYWFAASGKRTHLLLCEVRQQLNNRIKT